jgi:hypothetical protein
MPSSNRFQIRPIVSDEQRFRRVVNGVREARRRR